MSTTPTNQRGWHYPPITARVLDDSERNQLAELRHEACEQHCDECGACDWEPTGPTTTRTVPMVEHNGAIYCPDCIPETWKPEPDPADGYAPGPEIAATYNDVTLTVQRTHLHADRAAYYWRIMVEGHAEPASDGTIIALDPTMTTRSVALALAWNLYATEAARAIAGDSPILIHHTPAAHYGLITAHVARIRTRYQDEMHEIHMEMS